MVARRRRSHGNVRNVPSVRAVRRPPRPDVIVDLGVSTMSFTFRAFTLAVLAAAFLHAEDGIGRRTYAPGPDERQLPRAMHSACRIAP